MDVFKNERFEIGINMDEADAEHVRMIFQVMRECPECGVHPDEIGELEDEVWTRYFLKDLE